MKHTIHMRLVAGLVAMCAVTISTVAQPKAPSPPGAGGAIFRAGASMSKITPVRSDAGDRGTTTAYVHDDLHARCLALDDGNTRLIFIVVDAIGLSRELIDKAKRLIHEETNIPWERVLISATHTHSGARRTAGDYNDFLIDRIAASAKSALNNLEPARIGWGVGSVPEHVFVRRWKMKPGTPIPNPFGGQDRVRMNPVRGDLNLVEQTGRPDPEVSFISVQSTEGRAIALLANYSLHYVGGVPNGHVSADYFAVFAECIRGLLGADGQDPPFVGIMSNGTSGDVNNIDFRKPAENLPPYAKMRLVAEDVAREVLRVRAGVEHRYWVRLHAAAEELALELRKPERWMIAHAEKVLARPDNIPVRQFSAGDERRWANRITGLQDSPDQVNVVLQVFRIGELGVAAVPFETFAETGMEIKERSPFKSTFTIELANGSHGYLPTPEQHELGGYGTWLGANRVEKEASRKIVARLIELFEQLK